MNGFRPPVWNAKKKQWERPLDKKGLRVAVVHRLLRKQIIGQARALELLAQRFSPSEMKTLRGTVELWKSNALKHMLP